MVGREGLCLQTCHHFAVVEVKTIACLAPCVIHKDGACAMVAVRVDGPVSNHHVGLLGFNQGFHLCVACLIDFGIAVNLCHEYGTYTHHLAGFCSFCGANGTRLLVRLTRDSCFASCEIHRYNLYAHLAQFDHRAAAHRFGVIGMSAYDKNFLVTCVPFIACLDTARYEQQYANT